MSQSKDLFFLLLDRLKSSNIATVSELGGHSTVWALRSQIEGCKVYVAPIPSAFTLDNLAYKKSQNDDLL